MVASSLLTAIVLPALGGILSAPPVVPRSALYQPAEQLPRLIAAAGTKKQHQGADVVEVLDRRYVHVMASGLAHVTRRRVWKALTARGGSLLAVRRFDYDPATHVVRFLRIRVHRPGRPPVDHPPTRVKDLAQPAGWIFWKTRMLVLALPRLRVGDALEVITYEKGFQIAYLGGDDKYVPPMKGHFYDTVLFGAEKHPVLLQTYRASTPRSKPLRYKVYNGTLASSVTYTKTRFVYDFARRNIPRFKREPGSPYPSDSVPKVVLATVAKWPAKSRWFHRVNAKQFRANAAIRAKVKQILNGRKTRREKVKALLRWVAANIRYRGLSMGKGEGYTLHKGTRVFAHRAGVCKDIASMLVTLLRAAGFTAYPAMTMAGARVEDVPADQFNHCVVALAKPRGGYEMLDPTWAPLSRQLWSNAERLQHYLIGTPRGEKLQLIPAQKASANQLNVKAETRLLGARGDVRVALEIWATGYPDSALRRQLGSAHAPGDVRHYFERIAGRISPQARVGKHGFRDFADLEHRFGLRLTVRAPRYAQWGQRLVRFRPVLWNHVMGDARSAYYLRITKAAKRTQPVLLRCSEQVTFTEHVTLPRGYRLLQPLRPVSVKRPGASLLMRGRKRPGRLDITTQLIIAKRRFTASEYKHLKAVIDALRGLRRRAIYLVRSGR